MTLGNQTIENLDVSMDGRWVSFSSNRSGASQIYRQRVGDGAARAAAVDRRYGRLLLGRLVTR